MTATEPQPAAAADPRRWVSSTPDEISHHSGDGHRYARWGQSVISYDEEREPIPTVYSAACGGGEIEFGSDHTWRLSLAETEAFIERLQHAVRYERTLQADELRTSLEAARRERDEAMQEAARWLDICAELSAGGDSSPGGAR